MNVGRLELEMKQSTSTQSFPFSFCFAKLCLDQNRFRHRKFAPADKSQQTARTRFFS